jgi:hypothetical protein
MPSKQYAIDEEVADKILKNGYMVDTDPEDDWDDIPKLPQKAKTPTDYRVPEDWEMDMMDCSGTPSTPLREFGERRN